MTIPSMVGYLADAFATQVRSGDQIEIALAIGNAVDLAKSAPK